MYICSNINEVPVAMKVKHPAGVMVLGAVSSDGHVMPPHFFGPGEKVTADVYLVSARSGAQGEGVD